MSISLNAAEFDRIVRLSQEGAGYEYESWGAYDNHLIVYVQVGARSPNGQVQWVREGIYRSEAEPPASAEKE